MYILGDTHGIRPIFQIIDKYKLKDCSLIHVGDLGLGFQEITRDVNNLLVLDEMLIENNINFYGIRGNHDFKMFWDKSMGLKLPKFHHLHLVEDDSILNIENKRVFFSGGATSIDRSIRKEDNPITWDYNEKFIFNKEKLKKKLSINKHIDIVVTHSIPDFANPIGNNVKIVNDWVTIEKTHGLDLRKELGEEREQLTELYELLAKYNSIKYWFAGHFHKSYKTIKNGTEFIVLGINELKEVN